MLRVIRKVIKYIILCYIIVLAALIGMVVMTNLMLASLSNAPTP